MKKVLILAVALTFVFSGMAFASVVGSKHDMTSTGTNQGQISDGTTSGTTTQVCVFCHHPHRTNSTAVEAQLLWNRNGSGTSATKYATYASGLGSFTTLGVGGSLGPNSNTGAHHTRLCLSCHDSTYAVTVVDTVPRGLTASFSANYYITATQANIGGDTGTLTNDHPVDFNYSAVAASTVANGEFPTPTGNIISTADGDFPLYGNYMMECGTCHDPHNSATSSGVMFIRNAATGAGGDMLVGSKLCRDCHTNH